MSVLLRQTHGFEGLRVVVVLLCPERQAVFQHQDQRKRLREPDTAGLSAHRHVCEHCQPFPRIDEFERLRSRPLRRRPRL